MDAYIASKNSFPTALTAIISYGGLHRFELVYYSKVSLRERSYVFSSPRMR